MQLPVISAVMDTLNSILTPGASSTPFERREWIKYQLRLRGLSLGEFSRRIGCSRQATALALKRAYPRVQRLIASEIGVPVHVLWPEWYGLNGERLQKVGRPSLQQRAA